MVSFDAHFFQATRNLSTLETLLASEHYDWQVTVSFYVALHLLSAHLAHFGVHESTHAGTERAILPDLQNKASVKSDIFNSYCSLQRASRIARYLHEGGSKKEAPLEEELITGHTDVSETLAHLNEIMIFFSKAYKLPFDKIKVKSAKVANELKNPLDYFEG